MRASLVPFLLAFITGANAQDPVAGLWLTDLGPRHAVVSWWAERADDGAPLLYGVRGEKPRRAAPVERGRFRSVRLELLEPEMTYEVRCGWRRTSFETPAATETELRIAVLGHTGGTHPRRRHPPQMQVARVRDLRPDAVIHAGDAVYWCTERAFRNEFFRFLDPVIRHVPVYLGPGNHECGFPAGAPSYDVFKRALAYPYADAARKEGAPPCWVVERGSVRMVFVTYFDERLRPGTPQRTWLDTVLSKRTKPFTFLICGLGQSTFRHRDEILKSLPGDQIDLLIGGDGEGASITKEHGHDILFCGSSRHDAHPYALLECRLHEVVINVYDTSGKALLHHTLHDRSPRTLKADLLPAFGKPAFLEGGTVKLDADGLHIHPGPGVFQCWAGVPRGKTGRSVQFEMSVVVEGKHAPHQDVYVQWHPKDHPVGRMAYRSKPQPVALGRGRQTVLVRIPDQDPFTETALPLKNIGLRLEGLAVGVKGIIVHSARLVD